MRLHGQWRPDLIRRLDSIVTGEGNRARVDLLLDRASEWVDVDSYLPFEGKVVLKIKTVNSAEVRRPEWVRLNEVPVEVDSRKAEHKLDARSLLAIEIRAGSNPRVLRARTDNIPCDRKTTMQAYY